MWCCNVDKQSQQQTFLSSTPATKLYHNQQETSIARNYSMTDKLSVQNGRNDRDKDENEKLNVRRSILFLDLQKEVTALTGENSHLQSSVFRADLCN